MRRLLAASVGCLLLLFCGCGGSPQKSSGRSPGGSPPPAAPFVCHHKQPAQAGECIRQELEAKGVTPAAPRLGAVLGAKAYSQCVDISRWQPHPRFRQLRAEGIVCVIVQGADNVSRSNPFFDEQVRDAHEAGMTVGAYIYVEGGSSVAQADALGGALEKERVLIVDGVWVDTEQTNAYPHACGIAERLRSHWHYKIVGDYGSVGTVPAWMNVCHLLDWPAMWGGGSARPAPGFTFAEVKIRQWCGTCVLGGNDGQIDRDEDLGLLELAKPAPTRAQRNAVARREVVRLYVYRRALRHLISSRHCPPYQHAGRKCRGWRTHGQQTNTRLRALHTKGFY